MGDQAVRIGVIPLYGTALNVFSEGAAARQRLERAAALSRDKSSPTALLGADGTPKARGHGFAAS